MNIYLNGQNSLLFDTVPLTFCLDLDSENYKRDLMKFVEFFTKKEHENYDFDEKKKKIGTEGKKNSVIKFVKLI